jgi:hypothetical protein
MRTRSGVTAHRVLACVALSALAACVGDRSEAQPDGPVGLTVLDRASLATAPTLDAMTPADRRGAMQVAAQRASNFLTVQRGAAAPDSLQLPQLRRWGATRSVPLLTRFLDDSLVAVIHADVDGVASSSRGAHYLSLVNVRTGQVCLDLPVPVAAARPPHFTWRADTLLATVPSGDASGGSAVRVRFQPDVTKCPWNYVARAR